MAYPKEGLLQRAYYCKVMGVPFESDLVEVRERFRRLAMEYHPDRMIKLPVQQRKHAEEMFKLIQEAYKFLSDPPNFYHGEPPPDFESPPRPTSQVPENSPESLSRCTPGCTGYPLIGAWVGGVGLVIAAALFVWLILGMIIFAVFSYSYSSLFAILLAIFGGAIAAVVLLAVGSIGTVSIALILALIGAVMGFFDGIVVAVISLVTKAPGIMTAIPTAFICGIVAFIIGTPFWGSSTWGLVVFCSVFNALVGGITGFVSQEIWTDFTDSRQEWQTRMGLG